MLRSWLSLAVIVSICALLLVTVQRLTGERIAQNQRAHELELITELAGASPPAGTSWSGDVWDLCNGELLARSEVVGYGGPMALLLAVTIAPAPPRLRGVRITRHQETPGLADFLQDPGHGWLGALAGRQRNDIDTVDAVAGATITSRAVLKGVLRGMQTAQARTGAAAGCSS